MTSSAIPSNSAAAVLPLVHVAHVVEYTAVAPVPPLSFEGVFRQPVTSIVSFVSVVRCGMVTALHGDPPDGVIVTVRAPTVAGSACTTRSCTELMMMLPGNALGGTVLNPPIVIVRAELLLIVAVARCRRSPGRSPRK